MESCEGSWQHGGTKTVQRRSRSSARSRSSGRSISRGPQDGANSRCNSLSRHSTRSRSRSTSREGAKEEQRCETEDVSGGEEIFDEEVADAIITDCSFDFVGDLISTAIETNLDERQIGLEEEVGDDEATSPSIEEACHQSSSEKYDYSDEIVNLIVHDALGLHVIEDEHQAYDVHSLDARSPSPQHLWIAEAMRSPSPHGIEDIDDDVCVEDHATGMMGAVFYDAVMSLGLTAEEEKVEATSMAATRETSPVEASDIPSVDSSAGSSGGNSSSSSGGAGHAVVEPEAAQEEDVDDGDLSTEAADSDDEVDLCSEISESSEESVCDMEGEATLDRVFSYAFAPTPEPCAASSWAALGVGSLDADAASSWEVLGKSSSEELQVASELVERVASEAQSSLVAMLQAVDEPYEVYEPDADIIERSVTACAMARQEALAAGVGSRADKAATVIQQKYRTVIQQREASKHLDIQQALAAFENLAKLAMQDAAAAIQRRWRDIRQRPASAMACAFPVTAPTKPLEGAPARKRPGTAPGGRLQREEEQAPAPPPMTPLGAMVRGTCEQAIGDIEPEIQDIEVYELEASAPKTPTAPTTLPEPGRFKRGSRQQQEPVEPVTPASPTKPLGSARPGSRRTSRPRPAAAASSTLVEAVELNPVSAPARHVAKVSAPKTFSIGKDAGYVPFNAGEALKCEFEAHGKTEIFSVRTPAGSSKDLHKGHAAATQVSLPALASQSNATRVNGSYLPELPMGQYPAQTGVSRKHPLNPTVRTPRKSADADLLS